MTTPPPAVARLEARIEALRAALEKVVQPSHRSRHVLMVEDMRREAANALRADDAGGCVCSIGVPGAPNPGNLDGCVACPVHGPFYGSVSAGAE